MGKFGEVLFLGFSFYSLKWWGDINLSLGGGDVFYNNNLLI